MCIKRKRDEIDYRKVLYASILSFQSFASAWFNDGLTWKKKKNRNFVAATWRRKEGFACRNEIAIERDEENVRCRKRKRKGKTLRERRDSVRRGTEESTETAWEWENVAVGVRWRSDRASSAGEGGTDRDRERGLVCRAQLRRAPCDERYTTRVRSRCLRKGDRSPLLSFPLLSSTLLFFLSLLRWCE